MAESDLIRLADYVSDQSAVLALSLIDECQRAFGQLRDFPESGHPHVHLPDPYRVLPIRGWLVVHRLDPEYVEVVRIVHGSQDLRRLEL
jgi:toxin ParE1/3/4